ncbi:hypothetical protein EYV94_27350 [Puteibacter caeruleilacunae]|nr:hypothetical protein EYV94_27350 [Puteibacter caeruleilacunae]
MTRLFYFIMIMSSCCLKTVNGQDNSEFNMSYYSQAMEYLTGNKRIGKTKANYSNVRVSPQVVPFDMLGWFFQSEISKKTKKEYLADGDVKESDYKNIDCLENFSNFKKSSKNLIFFSEIRNDFLIAEVMRETNNSDYLGSTLFCQSTAFLFEYFEGRLKNVTKKEVFHN